MTNEFTMNEGSARLTVIIVSFNTRDYLRACLASIFQLRADNAALEIVVVDNASSDGSADMVRSEFPKARLIALKENVGFGRANNIGLRQSQARYQLILNSDTEIVDNALEQMCCFMDAEPTVGALGPQLLNTDQTIQLSCRRFPSYRTAFFNRYSILTRLFPKNRFSAEYLMTDDGHSQTREVDWVSGACLMTRRETLADVGLLDEEFFMYAEDVDWCYRMKQTGWKIVYFPEAQVIHHIGRSTRRARFRMIYERHRSMWLFYRKHYSRGIVLVDVATYAGIWMRCAMLFIRTFLQSLFRKETPA